jgi:Putative collagen-binding domain of a collagenase
MSGISLQSMPSNVGSDTRKWVTESAKSGHKWVVANDEQGPADVGVLPDTIDFNHDDIRKNVLWGNLMNNGAGVQYYFGYKYADSDLTCQNFRSRANMWKLSNIAHNLFVEYIPFWEMSIATSTILSNPTTTKNSCLATENRGTILVYLYGGGSDVLNLTVPKPSSIRSFSIQWYDPINGGDLQNGPLKESAPRAGSSIGNPPSDKDQDWVVLLRGRDNGNSG